MNSDDRACKENLVRPALAEGRTQGDVKMRSVHCPISVFLFLIAVVVGCDTTTEAKKKAVTQGTTALDVQDFDLAISCFTEAIRLDAKDPVGYYNRAVAYGKKGEFDKAIADYTEAIRLDPQNAQAYCIRGVTYSGKGETDKAIEDLTEAIRLDRTNVNAYYCRSLAYKTKGEKAKAESDFAQYEELYRRR